MEKLKEREMKIINLTNNELELVRALIVSKMSDFLILRDGNRPKPATLEKDIKELRVLYEKINNSTK